MTVVRSFSSVLALWALSLSTLLAAQIVPVPAGQPRDAAPQPMERRIPVGTASISGAVVAADTGRPVQGAQVRVYGQSTVDAAATPGRGGVPGGFAAAPVAITAGMSGGVRGGIPVQGTGGLALSRMVITNSNGEFSFPRLPAGQFTVAVYQNQFLQTAYGQRRPGGQGALIQLADGQQVKLTVPMIRGAVITGLVVGPDGEPQRNAQVRGWRFDMSSGFKRLQPVAYAQTDDRGIYRMFGLQPGDYVVSATPNPSDALNAERMSAQADLVERAILSGQVMPPAGPGLPPTVAVPAPSQMSQGNMLAAPSYLATYAPSSMVPSSAATVAVAAAEERTGVDIHVQLTQASNVQGVILTPLDPGVTVQVSLVSDDSTIDGPQTSSARPDATGKFTFRNVQPGRYTLIAHTMAAPPPMTIVNGQPVLPRPPQPVLTDAQKMWGKTQVTVAGEPTVDVIVSLQPARTISGIVVFDMAKPPDLSRSRLSVSLSSAPTPQQINFGAQPSTQVSPDGRFTLTGVVPGRYIVRAGGPQMKSSMVAGQDTLDFPLEFTGEHDVTDAVLTLTDQTSELSGTLTDSAGKPAVDYMIVVAASDSRYWTPGSRRVAIARPSPDGRYVFRSLPPGVYQIAAVIDLEPGAQYDPEFLRTVARASWFVTMTEGGKVSQDLRVK